MIKRIVLILILVIALLPRFYRINNPLADWHSWRQADTSAVSRNFIKNGFDLLHPQKDDISNVASGYNNPKGYMYAEFPIYNFMQAGLYKIVPSLSIESCGRLVSIILSLGTLIFIYFLTKKYLGKRTAYLAALFFAILPFNIYYNRVILPEPLMVFAGLGALYFVDRWIEKYKFADALLGFSFLSLSLLLKPYMAAYMLPLAPAAFYCWRFNIKKWVVFSFLLMISLLPLYLWRQWMSQFPEGIPYYLWLFNKDDIRFKGAFFYWIFAERIAKLILGYWGLPFFVFGLIAKPVKKENLFFYSWLLGILAYFVVIAAGNVRHDYYQIIAIPIICIFLAKGVDFVIRLPKELVARVVTYPAIAVCFLFMIAFSWYQIRDYFNINNYAIIEAGKAADELLPKGAKVIAPYGGDVAFLYQTNRKGWPVGVEIDKMIKDGAEYYVNVDFGPETQWLMGKYCVVKKTSAWIIINLLKECSSNI